MKPLRVLLITSAREACGIREYGKMLQAAVEKVSAGGVDLVEFANPDFDHLSSSKLVGYDLVHVNHHAALHSSWTTGAVRMIQNAGWSVVVTQHDTFETLAIMRERGFPMFQEVADYVVQHELVAGMYGPVAFIRQGVLPAPAPRPPHGKNIVGTVGFGFPWKNHEMLERAAEKAGWQALILDPGTKGWLDRDIAVGLLAGCDATAFLYSTGNSGTSGAIRLGLAARRPLIALSGCRQFRDLELDRGLGVQAIHWVPGEEGVVERLKMIADLPTPAVVRAKLETQRRLADRDSWENVAKKYILLYAHLRYRRAGA